MKPDVTGVDPALFRRAVGQFATGVTVITVQHDDDIHGMTANSFTSVSLDPPLVLFCVTRTARMASLIENAHGFAVNILSDTQQQVSRQFAGSRKEDAVRTITLRHGPVAPLIEGSLAALSCETETIHDGGDHWIVIGRVVDVHLPDEPSELSPLVFFRSHYVDVVEPVAAVAQAEAWSNEAIRIYHDEWGSDEGDPIEHAHTSPW